MDGRYLFNGDIADRGGHALEIFILLFLFKLLCPQSVGCMCFRFVIERSMVQFPQVYILRGNHEDDYCNLNYGFLAELRHKFGQVEGGRMHRDFLRVQARWEAFARICIVSGLLQSAFVVCDRLLGWLLSMPANTHAGST